MKQSILWLGVIAILSQTAYAEALSSRKTQGFIKDFYKAMSAREDKKLDTMIAAIARSRHDRVVTNNTKNFINISGLGLENWIV